MSNPHRRPALSSRSLRALRRSIIGAALLGQAALGALPSQAQAPGPAHAPASAPTPSGRCVLLFGQGRNFDPDQPAANRRWDEVNGAFNLAVREPLVAAGLPVVNMVLPVTATDVPRNLQGLLAEVQRRGCTRVLETSLFADPQQGLLIARLRVYPVIGLLGPQAPGSQPRIGAVAHTQQKEFTLDARVMDRVNPSRLGRVMAEEALAQLAPAPSRAP